MEISELNRNIQRLQAEIASVKKQVGRVLTVGSPDMPPPIRSRSDSRSSIPLWYSTCL